MIIWINGAFGAGKSQTAYELHRRIPNSFVFDPENAGLYIRKNTPRSTHLPDFQDYPMWRDMNYQMLKYIHEHYDGITIVPMTIVEPGYFDELVGRLRREGIVVHHFALCASREVLLKRLRSRGDGANSWPAKQIDRCVNGLSDPVFDRRLDTDQMTIEDVVQEISSSVNVPLLPDERGYVRKAIDRTLTQLKLISR